MKSPEELKDLHGEKYVASYRGYSPARLKRLLEHMTLESTDQVADFACGNGLLMEIIAPRVKSYVGIDFSEPFIKAALEKKEHLAIANAEFVCSDIHTFCQSRRELFDVGFAMDFSEHVYDDEWSRILASIRRSLKPKGKLYLHTPNAEFLVEKMKSRDFLVKQFPEHVAVRTPRSNVSLLREAGFHVAQVLFIPHYNILRIVHPLSRLPVVGKYFRARIFIEAIAGKTDENMPGNLPRRHHHLRG